MERKGRVILIGWLFAALRIGFFTYAQDSGSSSASGESPIVNLDQTYQCMFRGQFLLHKQEVRVDPCTLCTCNNGTASCQIESCSSAAGCPWHKVVIIPEECCPQCPYIMIVENTNILYEETFEFSEGSTKRIRFALDVEVDKKQSSRIVRGTNLWKLSAWISSNWDGSGQKFSLEDQIFNYRGAEQEYIRKPGSQPLQWRKLRYTMNFQGGTCDDYKYFCVKFDEADEPEPTYELDFTFRPVDDAEARLIDCVPLGELCTSATSTEYGKLLGTFTDTAYGVAGTIYVIDARRIWLRGFSYNGQGPDAFFYVGSSDRPSESGVIVPNENEQTSVLGAYSDRNFILTLPEDITTYKWFSVWCRGARANFGDISIPADFVAPAPVDLGSFGFDPKVHDVSATKVTILNTKQVKFTNLVYDGQGPEAFFWVGDGDVPMAGGKRVPHVDDDNGVKLRGYTGEDVIVTLEGTDRIFNFGYISIWCAQALQDFGNAVIPADLNVPPYVASDNPPPIMPGLPNCKVLKEDRFHIWWKVDEAAGKLRLRFEGTVKRDEYMSFGISGSQTGTSMPKSDVIVAYIGEDGEAGAMDYYLQSRSQCVPTNGDGACPDVLMGSAGAAATNDVTLLSSTVNRGITIIDVERPLAATDAKDKAIALAPTYVSWAIGELNPEKRVSKHSLLPRGDVQVDFSQESSSCPRLAPPAGDKVVTPWVIDDLTPEPAPEVITAHIGPSGGEQGYQGIAGQVGWGIAWYLNGLLVPELNVKRNNTYKFEIYGGNDNSTNLANFHPFYITSDSDGGYNQKPAKGKEAETIYAGPTGGELCDFTSMADPKDFDTFEKYAETLDKTCPSMVKPGILEWTVDPDTPDVVYYQCYQHRYFGWKINVSGASQTAVSLALMVALLTLTVFNQI